LNGDALDFSRVTTENNDNNRNMLATYLPVDPGIVNDFPDIQNRNQLTIRGQATTPNANCTGALMPVGAKSAMNNPMPYINPQNKFMNFPNIPNLM
jgi:hypothetical protein